jgi:hypothetical protein
MSAMADIGVGGATPAAAGYFVDQKKGEVNELKMVGPIVPLTCQCSFFRYRIGRVCAVAEEHTCRKGHQAQERGDQESDRVHDSWHRCISALHGYDNGKCIICFV